MPKRTRKNRPHTTGTTFKNLQNHLGYLEPLKAEQVEQIHQNSLKILRDAGIKVLSAPLRQHLKSLGCLVDGENFIVRADADFIMEHIAKAPKQFTLTPRQTQHRLHIGGNHVNFGMVSGPPNASDRKRGRRPSTYQDFQDLMRLAQSLNNIHCPRQSSRRHHRPARAYAPFGLYVQRIDPHR